MSVQREKLLGPGDYVVRQFLSEIVSNAIKEQSKREEGEGEG